MYIYMCVCVCAFVCVLCREQDLRSMVPCDLPVQISTVENPINAAWRGGSWLATQPGYAHTAVTKAEYEEHGHNICRRRFLT